MVYRYLLFFALFLHNVELVSSIIYSCDRTAECGCSKTNANVNKIVGGESAVDSSWGWAVSLQRSSGSAFCGGTIISPLHIITAAHCVKDSSSIIRTTRVIVGIDKLSQSTLSMAQVRSVVRVFSHPSYDDDTESNDIAVLRLDRPLNISNVYSTARLCLPDVVSSSMVNDYPVVDSPLVGIGWGILRFGDQTVPYDLHLQQVTLNAMSANHRMCTPTLRDARVQFCAAVINGGKGKK
jgi:secreted trypsin-like serine protease